MLKTLKKARAENLSCKVCLGDLHSYVHSLLSVPWWVNSTAFLVSQGEPVYVTMSKQTCVYEFLWLTSTACPVNTKYQQVFDNCTAINPQTKVLFNLQSLTKSDENYLVRDVKDNRTSFALNVCKELVKPNGKWRDENESVNILGILKLEALE